MSENGRNGFLTMLKKKGEKMEAIEVKNLDVSYGANRIIEDMNLSFPKGKISIIIGANGCGKSTLLKTIARIVKAQGGQIYINGKDIRQQSGKNLAKQVAVLPQSPKCPEAITVRELVAYGRFPYQKAMGGMTAYDKEAVERALEKTDMTELANRLVHTLSGGQRQRAWIAMTLAQETDMILLDEPTTYLDMSYQLEILQILEELNLEKKITIIVVLHELNLACRFADHIVGLKNGKVICEGKPADVITEHTLKEIYGIEATLAKSTGGYPVCMEFDLL